MPFDPIIAATIVLIAWVILRVMGGERRQRLLRLEAEIAAEAAKQAGSSPAATSVR